jgi:sphingomyelin phosphodiesterase
MLYDLFKRMLGAGPVYAALGNHDSYNQFVFILLCCFRH